MSKKRILIQDIADSLKLSRTTVSKVLNGNTGVAPKTRSRVLQKAAELNYKQISAFSETSVFTHSPQTPVSSHGCIALLYHKYPDKQHSGSSVLAATEKNISRFGYTLSLFSISDSDLEQCLLPHTLCLDSVDAIFCIEVFDRNYSHMLNTLKKPVVFLDSYYTLPEDNLKVDLLITESRNATARMVRNLIHKYCLTKVGFIGAITHCISFYERWTGFCMALMESGIPLNEEFCIIESDDSKYWDFTWMKETLEQMNPFPELFVCANDALAIQLITCLKKMHLSVPGDVMVTGFDNSPASSVVAPALTTVDSHNEYLGAVAAKKLLDRIREPEFPYTETVIQSQIVFRESTGH